MSDLLKDWIGISAKRPKSPLPMVEFDGEWLYLKKPLIQWPKGLRKLWDQELTYLFEMEVGAGDFLGDQKLCLCLDTIDCGEKNGAEENRRCLYYARGICLSATTLATETPISFGLMGRLFGISKQRVQQIYVGAQKKMIRKVLSDPFLKEYCLALGVGKSHLPSTDDLLDEIDDLLKS